jgi:ABC-type glucose/galactose transport system permease subunit
MSISLIGIIFTTNIKYSFNTTAGLDQYGKFVLRGGEIPCALSMLSIYLLLNFRNLPGAIC